MVFTSVSSLIDFRRSWTRLGNKPRSGRETPVLLPRGPILRGFVPEFVRRRRFGLIGAEAVSVNFCKYKIFGGDRAAGQPSKHCELPGMCHRIRQRTLQ